MYIYLDSLINVSLFLFFFFSFLFMYLFLHQCGYKFMMSNLHRRKSTNNEMYEIQVICFNISYSTIYVVTVALANLPALF